MCWALKRRIECKDKYRRIKKPSAESCAAPESLTIRGHLKHLPVVFCKNIIKS